MTFDISPRQLAEHDDGFQHTGPPRAVWLVHGFVCFAMVLVALALVALLAEQAESAGGGLRTLLPFLSADFRRTIDVMLGVKAIIPLLEPMIEAARFVAANHSDTVPELLDRLGPDRQHYVVGSLAVECLEAGDVEGARRWLGFSAPAHRSSAATWSRSNERRMRWPHQESRSPR